MFGLVWLKRKGKGNLEVPEGRGMGPSKREAAISSSSDNSDSPKSRLDLAWKLIDVMVVND